MLWKLVSAACAAGTDRLSRCAGDKTVAMWLMNAELYDGMSTFEEASPVIVRGMALHKMIHGLTMALGAPPQVTWLPCRSRLLRNLSSWRVLL